MLHAQYLQLVLGLSPLFAALSMIPMAVFGVGGVILASILIARLTWRKAIVLGLGAASFSFVGIALATPPRFLVLVLLGGVVLSAGVSMFLSLSLATDLTVAAASQDHAGSASALSEAASELGAALSIAVLGTASSAVYRNVLALPAGLRGDDAAQAGQSLQNASAVAATLPAQMGEPLVEAARTAFATGQSVVAAGAAVVLLVLACAVAVSLGNSSMSGE